MKIMQYEILFNVLYILIYKLIHPQYLVILSNKNDTINNKNNSNYYYLITKSENYKIHRTLLINYFVQI